MFDFGKNYPIPSAYYYCHKYQNVYVGYNWINVQ